MQQPEITLSNGRKAVNPIGSCFDAAGWVLLSHERYDNATVCHGVAVANMPGQEGNPIAHAWLELDHEGERYAVDVIWMVGQPVEKYRKDLQVSYCVEYSKEQFVRLWLEYGFPGPYDQRIAALTLEGKAAARSKCNA